MIPTTQLRLCTAVLLATGLGVPACGGQRAGDRTPFPGPCSDERDDGNDGVIDSRTTYTYNDQDLVVQAATDADLNGETNFSTIFEYDENGYVVLTGYDSNPPNGEPERGYRFVNDAEGRVLEWAYHQLLSNPPWWRYTYTYDAEGYRSLTEYDEDADGIIDEEWTHTWNGDHTVCTVEIDRGLDGTVDAREVYTYTTDGDLLTTARDEDADGVDDNRGSTTYDDEGNAVLLESDFDGDGTLDQTITRVFDDDGNLLSYLLEADSGDVYVTYDYSCWY